jgi:DNA topoisomerase-2
MDGLKPSTRKVLFASFKYKKDIKVSQLAADVSKRTEYKHGEKSLEGAIVGMAQNFVGSNNINLLYPSGNFGYRKMGGKEAASSRYIFTRMETIASKIFIKEDELILNYINDEGTLVEPVTYYPIIPMVLVNGAAGIGTGFSTNVPQYNPIDICNNIKRRLDGKSSIHMSPWYSGFKGTITRIQDVKNKEKESYKVSGKFTVNNNIVNITELPIKGNYAWTDKYIALLRGQNDKDKDKKSRKIAESKNQYTDVIKDVRSRCGNNLIDIDVEFEPHELQKLVKKGGNAIEQFLKLSVNMTVSNLYLHSSKGHITKYDSATEILDEYVDHRLEIYGIRKKYNLDVLDNELQILKYKIKYINDIITNNILVMKQKITTVITCLEKKGYPRLSKKIKYIMDDKPIYNEEDDNEDDVDNEIEEDDDKTKKKASPYVKSYKYLTDMKIFSLTQTKLDELMEEYKNKQAEYDRYNSITEVQLWKDELEDFIVNYKVWLKEKEEDTENNKTPSKKGRKSKK